jgi:hypothetical protein
MWGGLSAGSRPLGGFLFSTPQSLLEAGCRLIARPTKQFSHKDREDIFGALDRTIKGVALYGLAAGFAD